MSKRHTAKKTVTLELETDATNKELSRKTLWSALAGSLPVAISRFRVVQVAVMEDQSVK